MTKQNLTKPISLRLSSSVRKTVKSLSDETGLIQAQLFDLILRAGCDAIEAQNRKLPLPLKFEIVES